MNDIYDSFFNVLCCLCLFDNDRFFLLWLEKDIRIRSVKSKRIIFINRTCCSIVSVSVTSFVTVVSTVDVVGFCSTISVVMDTVSSTFSVTVGNSTGFSSCTATFVCTIGCSFVIVSSVIVVVVIAGNCKKYTASLKQILSIFEKHLYDGKDCV